MPRGKGTIAKKTVKKPKKIAKPAPPAFDNAVLIRIGNELDEYPERQEAVIKEKLYDAFLNSNKDIDEIVKFMEEGPDEWN